MKMKMTWRLLLAISCMALSSNAVSANTILYNNLPAATNGTDPVSSFGPLADSFSTGASPLYLVDVKLLLRAAGITGSLTVTLRDDN